MNDMKKKRIFLFCIILLFVITLIVIVFLPKKENNEISYTKKEIIEKISEGFANGISKKELEKLVNQELSDKTIMTGKDAYLLKTPSDKLIQKYNLDNYVTNQKTYFEKLDSKIKENYSWSFEGDAQDNQAAYYISVKTYEYGIYLSDLEEIQNQLLENYKSDNDEENEINQYKAQVVAMKLLDSHLDEYLNNNQPKTITISFTNSDSDETKASLLQYLIDLAGYNQAGEDTTNTIQDRPARMKTIIDEALNSSILNNQDLLSL